MQIKNNTMRKILKDSGAPRVSDEAAKELVKLVNDYAYDIAKKAIEAMKFSNRITVMAEDVIFAAR